MLSLKNGYEVLEKIREHSFIPVLMLTAKDSECDKVSGLRMGADDYLTKPFSNSEFMTRVLSLLRRYTIFRLKIIILFILVLLFMILSSLNTVVISMLCNLFMDVSQITILSVIYILTNMIKGGLLLFATITIFVYIAVLKRRYWINLLKGCF